MPLQSRFSNWPVWARCIAVLAFLVAFAATLSLMGGCGGVSSHPNLLAPDFYIGHLQDPHAVWFKSGANNPAPLTIPSLPLGSSVSDLAALSFMGSPDWLYLVSSNANSLVIMNKVGASFQLVATVPVGSSPFGLAIDDTASFAYVSNTAGNSVTVVDLISNQPVSTIALPAGSQPRGIAVTPDGKKVYVANQATNTLSVIDAVARTVIGSIAVGSQPNRMAMSTNGQELYVSNFGSGTVSVIDVLSDSVSTTISGVANTRAVAVDGAGTDLFVGQAPANAGAGSVAIYDTTTVASTTAPIATGANPVFLLGIGPSSFLSADQNAGQVSERWVTTGNAPVNPVWTVGAAPAALAIVRQINRTPSTQPQCTLTVATVGTGTVAATPSAAGGNYACGTTVTLTATPGTGQQFTQWSGDLTGTTSPSTLLMNTSKNVTATFASAQNVVTTVQSNNPFVIGLYITVDGTSWAGHAQYSAPAGSTHTHTTTSPQIVQGEQYTFQNWTPSPAPNVATALSQTVTLGNTNTAYIANFNKTGYVVSTYGCPVAITSPQQALSSSPLVYPLNAPLTINASLPAIEVFQNGAWTTYSSLPVNLTLNGPISIWAPCVIQKSATCVAPPSGLSGWWGFDPAGSGSVPDLSGNNNNGALVNGLSQAAGKVQAFLPSGTTYFQAPSSNSLNFGSGPFSAEMWIRWSNPSANNFDSWLMSKYGPVGGFGHGFDFALTRGSESPGLAKLMVRLYDGTVGASMAEWDTTGPAVPSDGGWHLVAFSYDPSLLLDNRVAFYVDGVLVPSGPFNVINTQNLSQSVVFDVSNAAPLDLGIFGNPVIPSLAFTGGIDEVELFHRVITAADLQPLMAADSLGKCRPSTTVGLTVNTSPSGLAAAINGTNGAAPISQNVASGVAASVSVTTPQVLNGSGYTFSNWTGAVASAASAITTVTPAANTTVTANFALACNVLTVNVSPVNSGTVALIPASGGLPGLPANCYAPGTVVTLTATGVNGNVLQSWTGATGNGNIATIAVNAPSTVTANFGQPANVTLTVATNPTGLQARIGASGAYTAAPIVQQVPANQTQFISVTDPQFVNGAGIGYSFTGWSTGGSTPTTTVQPASNFTATANFMVACYALTVAVAPAGSGTVALSPASGGLAGLPSNCYAPGTIVTLTGNGR